MLVELSKEAKRALVAIGEAIDPRVAGLRQAGFPFLLIDLATTPGTQSRRRSPLVDRAAVEELMDYAYLRNDHRLSNCKQFVLCISAKGLQYLTGLRAARSCLKRSDPGTFG
jgi:hypothetical protein